jgi:virginiamycin B lyase
MIHRGVAVFCRRQNLRNFAVMEEDEMNRRRSVCLSVFLVLIGWAAVAVPASAQHFQQIPGSLTQVAVGRTEVWGVNASNQTYRYIPGGKKFARILQTLIQIAVGGGTLLQADEVWGINASGQVYRYDFATKKFAQVPGVLAQIVVGEGDQDNCHPYEVWGINAAELIYRYNYCTSQFDQIPGTLTHIAVGRDEVWGLNGAAQIYQFNFSNQMFSQISGSLQQIAVGVNDVWGLDGSNTLYRFEEGVGFTLGTGGGQGADQISAGGDGVWIIDGGVALLFVPNYRPGLFGDEFVQVPSSLAQIAVGSGGGVWGVNSSHQVFVWVRP